MSENQQQQGLQFSKKTIISLSILLFVMLLGVGALTQIIPRGEYATDEITGEVIPGTYAPIDFTMKFWKVFAAPVLLFGSPDAMTGIAILLFIIVIGGTFLVLDKSGVLKYSLSAIADRYADKKYTLLALVTLVCMLMGSVMGMLEETLTLVPLAAAITLALGWDSLMGLGMSFMAVAFGYSAAIFNPFNVVVVQLKAGLPIFSGTVYRVVVFALTYALLYGFLYLYGKKIDKRPEKSVAYETDKQLREKYSDHDRVEVLANQSLKAATKVFVSCISGVFVFAAISFALQRVLPEDSGLLDVISFLPTVSMAVLFPVGGLLAGKRAGMDGKQLRSGFWDGVKAIAPAIPMLLLLLCVTYILKEGKIIDTMLYHVHGLCEGMTPVYALFIIFAFVLVLEFFVGSGTAKAFLILPIVVPLAGMLNLSMQNVTLAFCLSDGFGNIIYPTSGLMILAIGMLNISYGKYLRWFGKVFLAAMALSALAMWFGVVIGY